MVGPLKIEPLGGGTRFQKGNELAEPAICHFCSDFPDWPEYKRCERLLRGQPVGFRLMMWIFYRKIVRSEIVRLFLSELQRRPLGRKLILQPLKLLTKLLAD
jgi:hypothetical protein